MEQKREIKIGDLFIAIGIDQSIQIIDKVQKERDKSKPDKIPGFEFVAIYKRNGFTDKHRIDVDIYAPLLLNQECYEQIRNPELFS